MKNKQASYSSRVSCTVLLWVLSGAYTLISKSSVVCAEPWTRGRPIGTFPTGEVPFEPFVLNVWGSDGSNLTGWCRYYNEKPYGFEIDGQETSNGDFYPDVIYQISNGDGDWETLEAPSIKRGKRMTITVESRATSRPLRVNL